MHCDASATPSRGSSIAGGDLLEWPYQYTLEENFHKHELDKYYINMHLFSDLRNNKQFESRPEYTKMGIFEYERAKCL